MTTTTTTGASGDNSPNHLEPNGSRSARPPAICVCALAALMALMTTAGRVPTLVEPMDEKGDPFIPQSAEIRLSGLVGVCYEPATADGSR